jgi:hypothetical protein
MRIVRQVNPARDLGREGAIAEDAVEDDFRAVEGDEAEKSGDAGAQKNEDQSLAESSDHFEEFGEKPDEGSGAGLAVFGIVGAVGWGLDSGIAGGCFAFEAALLELLAVILIASSAGARGRWHQLYVRQIRGRYIADGWREAVRWR